MGCSGPVCGYRRIPTSRRSEGTTMPSSIDDCGVTRQKLFHNRRSAASQQARGKLQETPSCGRRRVERERPQSWPHRTVEVRMTNRVINIVFALALLGTCAVGQDKGQARTAASVG